MNDKKDQLWFDNFDVTFLVWIVALYLAIIIGLIYLAEAVI